MKKFFDDRMSDTIKVLLGILFLSWFANYFLFGGFLRDLDTDVQFFREDKEMLLNQIKILVAIPVCLYAIGGICIVTGTWNWDTLLVKRCCVTYAVFLGLCIIGGLIYTHGFSEWIIYEHKPSTLLPEGHYIVKATAKDLKALGIMTGVYVVLTIYVTACIVIDRAK